ncbi:ribonucleoprotein, putative [Trichophyton benhamiae CBS 112371]|uniref:Ribonucleoprotein, putative n=1 Tax=Arthroderma benhamiae (strain ATCC MYA-4681 / CBS 112371) TaxID=663331 RepID=D4AVP3_ARTBC|nr:ribonucleoprotein, putative [Trichophyton benhamiae CBS 112371]EFE32799.1 ribonucleoprotein, putative [Trichophyton benhamiae CBS 112371]
MAQHGARRSESSTNWRQREPQREPRPAARPASSSSSSSSSSSTASLTSTPFERPRWKPGSSSSSSSSSRRGEGGAGGAGGGGGGGRGGGNIRGFRGWEAVDCGSGSLRTLGARYHESPPSSSSKVQTPIHPAIVERRRLYVGNMPYMAKKEDVVELFGGQGGDETTSPYNIERIYISIDPFTGRNPSYCFVDLKSTDQAERAMADLNGKLVLGRPVKVNPGVPRADLQPPLGRRDPDLDSPEPREESNEQQQQQQQQPAAAGTYPPKFVFERWTRDDASKHWYGYAAEGRRLFVGGLPRMRNQPTVDYEIRKVFYGFNIEAISKVIISNRDKLPLSGSQYYYLFVDLESAEEADKALKTLDGVSAIYGNRLHIRKARGNSRKPSERDRWRAEHEKKKDEEKTAAQGQDHLLDAPIEAEGITQSLV